MNKAVFLDKDGTLIPDVPYNVDPERISLESNCTEGLKRLQSEGYLLIIVSNQPGVAHGFFEEHQLEAVKNRISELLAAEGIQLDGFYYCPHHPEGKISVYRLTCRCRKPQPGLLLKAAAELDVDLTRSWMVGDILNDTEAGNTAGCKTILIDNGNETEWVMTTLRQPDHRVESINQAAAFILAGQEEHAKQATV